MKSNQIEFYDGNQDQFTFLVLDKSKVDTFMSRYEPLDFSNTLIKADLLTLINTDFDNSLSNNYASFAKNTKLPDASNIELAKNVIKATYEENGESYFSGSLEYLFFNKCLPEGFQNKWTQAFLGDFRFNATFFAILRDKCATIDQMIYGDTGYWDKKLDPIFGEFIFNEITPDKAKQIKELIEQEESFNDIRFSVDRDNFIYFLDKTINNEWRLILRDWN